MKTEHAPILIASNSGFEAIIDTTPRKELSKDVWEYLRTKIEAEVEAKRAELEERLGYTVNAFTLYDKDLNECVGFLEEPHRATKMQCIDLYQRGQYTQADDILLQTCLLKSESDPRILAENPKRDKNLDALYLGALKVCEGLIVYYTEAQKKN